MVHNKYLETLLKTNIGQIAAHLMDIDEVILFQDTVIWKPPSSLHRVQWHQDFSYWPLDKPNGITIWISLTNADSQNGCMSFLPHSHQWGECQPMIFTAEKASPKQCNLPRLQWEENENHKIDYPCPSGFGAAMHPLNCHMSYANISNRDRLGWVISFVSPNVKWNPEHAVHPYNYLLDSQKGTALTGESFLRFTR